MMAHPAMGGNRGKDVRHRARSVVKPGASWLTDLQWADLPFPCVCGGDCDFTDPTCTDRRALDALLDVHHERLSALTFRELQAIERDGNTRAAMALQQVRVVLQSEAGVLPRDLGDGRTLAQLDGILVDAVAAMRGAAASVRLRFGAPHFSWAIPLLVTHLADFYTERAAPATDDRDGYTRERDGFVRAMAAVVGVRLDKKAIPYQSSRAISRYPDS